MDFEETVVIKNYVASDVVTKMLYFSFAGAALVFVAMLLLTGLHA